MDRMKERGKAGGEENQSSNVQPLTLNYAYLACYLPCLMISGILQYCRKFKFFFFMWRSRTLH